MCTAVNAALCNLVVNGLYVPCIASVAPPAIGNLVINTGYSASTDATAAWQVAEVLVWNRQLSVAELTGVSQYWAYTYALDWFTGQCAATAAHRFLPSVAPGVTNASASPTPDTGSAPVLWSGLTAYGGCTYDGTGGALQFDGVAGSYASFGAVSLAGDSLSTTVWVRFDAFQSNGNERIYELSTGANGGNSSISLLTSPVGYIRANAYVSTSSAACQAPTIWTTGTWAHVAVVFSVTTSTVTMYVNGAFACRASTAGIVAVPLSATMPAAYAALGKSSNTADKVRDASDFLLPGHSA
jgi:hypothetical protein